MTRLQKQDGDEDRSREWPLVESFKLQDGRQRNCVIRNVTDKSAELSDHNVSTNVDMSERLSSTMEHTDL